MDVREATPQDADALAALVSGEVDVVRLIEDRMVVVAEGDSGIEGFVSYDTHDGAVHVSKIVGTPPVVEVLLAEPRRFAAAEDIPIEIVVPADDDELRAIVKSAGFESTGEGPTFEGQRTHRFRLSE